MVAGCVLVPVVVKSSLSPGWLSSSPSWPSPGGGLANGGEHVFRQLCPHFEEAAAGAVDGFADDDSAAGLEEGGGPGVAGGFVGEVVGGQAVAGKGAVETGV